MTDHISAITQLSNRLSSSSYSNERVDALQELQGLSRAHPDVVGELTLKKVLEFLKDQDDTEECQEALDLVSRLIKCRDKAVSKLNTDIILDDHNNVELLLDLLNHEDLTIGVMTSQILTEIHSCNSARLEEQIQLCSDATNKLMLRLPDSSREEVRNQAIVLIQQLTSSNEEMKKAVAFNEGFETLLGIIRKEGGYEDAGLVVQDCLHICRNILSDSETCQRLFFAMGGADWILRFADFFNPHLLENIKSSSPLVDADDDDGGGGERASRHAAAGVECWFDDPNRLASAVLALNALYSSLSTPNVKHQRQVATSSSTLLSSACHWIARRGPADLVFASLTLLNALVIGGNSDIGLMLSTVSIKVTPAQPRKTIPADIDLPTLLFSWRPVPSDERRFIPVLSLLAERYLYPQEAWSAPSLLHHLQGKVDTYRDFLRAMNCPDDQPTMTLGQSCLLVFESILSVNSTIGDLIVQYVLAPPPPPDVDASQVPETMKPLGVQVLKVFLEGCSTVLESGSYSTAMMMMPGTVSSNYRSDIEVVERCANLFTIVFAHCSQLGKELSTAVTTAHAGVVVLSSLSVGGPSGGGSSKPLLPMLLSIASRSARLPGGVGYPVLVSILRMLSCIASGCALAAKQMLEDPANLFVVDLATVASESAGVPPLVQVSACFFLGSCFNALNNNNNNSNGSSAVVSDSDSLLNSKSFLNMIDSRIGLTRFTEILRKPVPPKGTTHKTLSPSFASMFITSRFKQFYQLQVEAIRSNIFEFYTGGSSTELSGGDVLQQQLIAMQRERIDELERRLSSSEEGIPHASIDSSQADALTAAAAAAEAAAVELRDQLQKREQALEGLQRQLGETSSLIASLELREAEYLEQLEAMREGTAAAALLEAKDAEILSLKQAVLSEHEQRKLLRDAVVQRDKKIELLMEELQSTTATQSNDRRLMDLENRNNDLTKRLWEVESQLGDATQTTRLMSSDDVAPIADALVALVKALEIEDYLDDDYAKLTDSSHRGDTGGTSISMIVQPMGSVLQQTMDALNAAIGECSDITEQAGVRDLEGTEGSTKRFVDCCRKLRLALDDAHEVAHDADRYRLDIEVLKTQLDESEKMRIEYSDLKADLVAQLEETDTLVEQLRLELEEAASKIASDARLIIEVKLDNSSLRAELEELLSSQAAAESERHRHSSLVLEQARLIELTEEVRRLRSEESRLTRALTTATIERDQAAKEALELTINLNAASESNDGLKELHSQVVAELESYRESSAVEKQELLDSIAKAESAISELTINLNAASESNDGFKELHSQVVAELESYRESSAVEKQELLDSIAKAESAISELTVNLNAASESNDGLKELHSQVVAELESYRESSAVEKQELLDNIAKAESTISELSINLNAASENNDGLKELHSQVVAELESYRESSAVEKQELLDNIAKAESTISELSINLNAASESYDGLKELHSRVEAELECSKDLCSQQLSIISDQRVIIAQLMSSNEELSVRYEALSKATEIQIKQLQNELDSSKLASDVFFENERRIMSQQLESVTQERDSLIEELKSEKTSLFKVEQIRKVNKMEFDDKISTMHKEISELYCLVEELKLDIDKKEHEISSQEDDLVAEQENCASLLIENEEIATKLKGVQEKLDEKTATSDLEVSSLKQAHEEETQRLQAALDVERANKIQLQEKFNNLSSISALETQDQELQRLTTLMDAITKELGVKEQQLNSAISQLKRREGEAAGVMATVDDMRTENEQLRTEFEALEKKHHSESKAAQENERALRASERDLKAKEQEVLSLKRILLAFESSSDSIHAEHYLLSTPNGAHPVDAKHASRPNGVTRPNGTIAPAVSELPNPVALPSFTPARDGLVVHSDAIDAIDLSSTSKAGKAIREVSPIIKQAAQLNTELLKERHRFGLLQEQHSDLLGLLAQQDVELSVYRDAISNRLGGEELASAEERAKQNSIDLYGSYIQLRYDL